MLLTSERRAERESKAVALPVELRSHCHLWSQAVGSNWKEELADMSSGNEFPLTGVSAGELKRE